MATSNAPLRILASGAALLAGLLLLAGCDSYRYDLGNSPQARAAKLAMGKYGGGKSASTPQSGTPMLADSRYTRPEADPGMAAPYISCASFADCVATAQDLDRKIGWTLPDFPIGYRTELYQLQQVAGLAIGFAPDDPQAYRYRARARAALQDWMGAIDDWTVVLGKQPGNEEALIQRAHLYLAQGYLERAVADANQALILEPANVDALVGRAAIRLRLQDPNGALDDATHALALKPHNVTALTTRASAHLQRKEEAPALADVEQAIVLTPRDSELYALRGNIHETFDEADLARADYRRACELGNPYWCMIAKRG